MNKPKMMVDMEMDDESKIDAVMPIAMPTKPDYPYGLRISLTEKELEKLGLDASEAFVGGTIHITGAMGEITSVSENDNGDGKCCRIEIQIQKMSVESEDAENDVHAKADEGEAPSRRKRAPLYG